MFFYARKEVIKITVEELDIVVQASVEQALTEFKKMVPQIKKSIKQVEENLNSVNASGIAKNVQQAVRQVKQKISEVKNTGVDKQLISQFDKAGASVSKYQNELEQTKQKLREVYSQMDTIQNKTWKEYTPEGVEIGNSAIEPTVNKALEGNKQFQMLSKEATKLEGQITSLNSKLNQTKQQYAEIGSQIQQVTSKNSIWSNAVNRVKTGIAGIKKNANNSNSSFNQMLKATSKINGQIKNIGKGMKNGLRNVFKYAAALFSLRSIYSALSSSASSWLSSQNKGAQQLSANIEYMKYAMGSMFAPIIEYVINLFYQLMKAIQSVVYALSGVNIFANASAKSYASMADSASDASKATKSLEGVHDEINNVSSSDSSSSSSGISTPSFDLSSMDSQMNSFAQKLYDFFAPLKESWDNYGQLVIESAKNALSGIISAVGTMWSSVENVITNGTIYQIISNILNSIGKIGQAWANAWNNDNNGTEIIQSFANMINYITEAILNLVSSTGFQIFLDGVLSAFSGIVQFLEPIVQGFTEMAGKFLEIVATGIGILLESIGNTLQTIAQNEIAVEVLKAVGTAIAIIVTAIIAWNVAQAILNGLMGIFAIVTSPITLVILAIVAAITAIILIIKNWGAISEWFGNLWTKITDTLKQVWESVKEFFINLWQDIINTVKNTWNGIKTFLADLWNGIKNTANNLWNGIKNTISTVINAIKTTISNVFNSISTVVSTIFNNVKNTITNIWTNIKTTISNIVTNIVNGVKDKFNSMSNAVSNIFNTIKSIISNVFNTIWNTIKGIINKILSGIETFINSFIRVVKKMVDAVKTVASYVGINLRINVSEISLPRLATGNVAYQETLAVFGEYSGASSNPEITAPQSIMYDTMMKALSDSNSNDSEQPIYLTVNVGNTKLGQILLDDLRNMKRRSGKNLEALVGG